MAAILSTDQSRKLRDILLAAYIEQDSFERMLFYRLNKRLGHIVAEDGLEDMIAELIDRAEEEDWTADLIVAAQKDRPRNAELRAFCEQLGLPTEPAPPSRPDPDPQPAQRRWIIVGAGLIALVVSGLLLWRLRPQPETPPPTPTIAPTTTLQVVTIRCTANGLLPIYAGPGSAYAFVRALKSDERFDATAYLPESVDAEDGLVGTAYLEIALANGSVGWVEWTWHSIDCDGRQELEGILPTPVSTPPMPALPSTPTVTPTPTSTPTATPTPTPTPTPTLTTPSISTLPPTSMPIAPAPGIESFQAIPTRAAARSEVKISYQIRPSSNETLSVELSRPGKSVAASVPSTLEDHFGETVNDRLDRPNDTDEVQYRLLVRHLLDSSGVLYTKFVAEAVSPIIDTKGYLTTSLPHYLTETTP